MRFSQLISLWLFSPFFFWNMSLFAVEPPNRKVLTFDEALKTAVNQSLDQKRAILARDLAVIDKDIVDYESNPKLTFQSTWSDRYSEVDSSKKTGSSGGSSNQETRDQNYSLQFNYQLYDFGRHSKKLEGAELQIRIKELSSTEVTELLKWKLARAYNAALSAIRSREIVREQLTISESKLREQKSNYEHGLRPESDVVSAEIDLGRVRLSLEKAESDEINAKRQLLFFMGWMTDATKPSPADDLIAVNTLSLPRSSLNMRSPEQWVFMIKNWKNFEPSESQKRRKVEMAALTTERASVEASKLPTLSLGVGAQESGSWQPLKPIYSGQLQLSWDIPWNGMLRDERERIARKSRDLDLQEDLEVKARAEKLQLAKDQLETLSRQWRFLKNQESLLKRQQVLVKQRYDAGKATAFELSTIDNDAINVRLDIIKLASSEANAVIDLAEALAISDVKMLF